MPAKYQSTSTDPIGLPMDKPPKGWQPPPPDWVEPADFIKPPWWDKAIQNAKKKAKKAVKKTEKDAKKLKAAAEGTPPPAEKGKGKGKGDDVPPELQGL